MANLARQASPPLIERFAASPRVLPAIWSIYVTLRLAVLLIPVTPMSDAEWYVQRASELAAGSGYLDSNGLPTAFWPPGWPLALSAVFRFTGPSLLAVGLFNLASALLIGWLTLLLARRLFGSEAGARLALLLLACYPNAIAYVPLGLTEVFYTALLMLGCWLVIERRSALWLMVAGLVFGIAALVKAQTLLVVPLLFAIEWLRQGDLWRRLPQLMAQGFLLLLASALVIGPWSLRNEAQLGHWVTVSTNGGYNLLIGNNEDATGGYGEDARAYVALMARSDLDEVARDTEAKRLALDWIRQNPGQFLALAPRKLALLWLPDGEAEWGYQAGAPSYPRLQPLYRAVRLANQAYYAVLLLCSGAALVLMTRNRRAQRRRWLDWWVLPWVIAAYPSLVAVMVFGQSRFHYPVMPFICVASGWAVAEAWRIWTAKTPKVRPLTATNA
ncbi:glycosyltransferase family 39 protein [Novosphingobium sp. M1R2S20]|uniref:Glycosyltransferase family 39 protein n=1 Tax=Novosphingobium rhizovicinum TaxID=3228928 RepID=A0ABV3R9J9_9SPHN